MCLARPMGQLFLSCIAVGSCNVPTPISAGATGFRRRYEYQPATKPDAAKPVPVRRVWMTMSHGTEYSRCIQ